MKPNIILGAILTCFMSTASFAAPQQGFTVNFSSFFSAEKPDAHFDFTTKTSSGHGDIASKQVPQITKLVVNGSPLTITNLTLNNRAFKSDTSCQNIDLVALQKQAQSNNGNIYVGFYGVYTTGIFYCSTTVRA